MCKIEGKSAAGLGFRHWGRPCVSERRLPADAGL